MKISSLGHVVLRVADRDGAERFDGGMLGLRLCARLHKRGFKMAFFTLGTHHDFSVMEVSGEGSSRSETAGGLHHVPFNIGSIQSTQSTLAAAAARLCRILAVCIPVLMFTNAPAAEHEPSKAAKGMPGAKGTIEYKPTDWAGNVTTYWKDTDGVNPGVAGCHVGVTQDGKPNGRFFGEACQSAAILIESNPGAGVVHSHANDLGHPDTFDCKAWCVGVKKAKGGVCKPASAPSPCTASARCECD